MLLIASCMLVAAQSVRATTDHASVPPDHGPGIFRGLLEPVGFSRRHWRSFAHVPPQIGTKRPPPRYVVMLDPGHGGQDSGAIGPTGLLEKHLTLDIARRVALFLSEIDEIELKMTRDDDTGLARRERVDKVRASEADLVVSLHLNHLPQTDVTLVESYYAGAQHLAGNGHSHQIIASLSPGAAMNEDAGAQAFARRSARIADILQSSVYNEVSFANADAVNAGVKQRRLFVLSESHTPGVLVEMTCLSNPAEEARLSTEEYRNRLAASIADGIRAYFSDADPLLLADRTI